MVRRDQKPVAQKPPLTEHDIQGALRVIQSLEKLVERPRLLKELLPGAAHTVSLAKHIHASRAARARVFGGDLFAEPAWDILLSLYIAERVGYRMKVSAVCNESGVADTTALRWIDRLLELCLIQKQRNPLDNRSTFIGLSSDGLEKMNKVLEKLWREHFPID